VWQEKNQTVSAINITSIELERLREFIIANRENLATKFNYETNAKYDIFFQKFITTILFSEFY